MSGLINYYGRTPEADNIMIKPVLLQKGRTKLALYGMSNVRDERLFRTFRDGGVKFFQPGTQKDDWFNIMSVHQNHHAYTETGYLPENFLPDFLDLVIWGHEHECKIDPRSNPETGFRVMQPGSSVATSLVQGEAVSKHVAILSVKGKDFSVETIRLKTVRPFVMKEIVLADNREMRDIAGDNENKSKITRFLMAKMDELIDEAKQSWHDAQQEAGVDVDEETEPPLPLIRLRVEYTAPEGGNFDIENPQRFSNRFVGKVANVNDVIQFHRKRTATARATKGLPDMPEESVMAQLSIDSVKVEKLVQEFLTAQSLTILPQNSFSDAVGQFVDKDDKHAMEMFVQDSLKNQVQLLAGSVDEDEFDEAAIAELMEEYKAKMERAFAKGERKRSTRKGTRKPKPDYWDSEVEERHWEDTLESIIRSDAEGGAHGEDEEEEENAAPAKKKAAAKGRGGKTAAAAATTKKSSAAAKKAPAKATNGRGKKAQPFEEDDDDDEDVIMLNDDDDDDSIIEAQAAEDDDDDANSDLFVNSHTTATKKTPAARKPTAAAAKKPPAKRVTAAKQSTLNFTQSQANDRSSTAATSTTRTNGRAAAPPRRSLKEPSEDEISDDDAFEPPPPSAARRVRR